MGTKNNPGDFDCYEAAEPDEPMFILLARDPLAPALVRMWATLRKLTRGASDKVNEAEGCASAMELWKRRREGERGKEEACRRCDLCEGQGHHWMEDPDENPDEPEYGCKHCSARGRECEKCDGDGIDDDGDTCGTCRGEGVLRAR